jgi:hypothetical protein
MNYFYGVSRNNIEAELQGVSSGLLREHKLTRVFIKVYLQIFESVSKANQIQTHL